MKKSVTKPARATLADHELARVTGGEQPPADEPFRNAITMTLLSKVNTGRF
ncbi:MAG: hypothetical protein ABI867_30445 [Kofleriaceae bacterium]